MIRLIFTVWLAFVGVANAQLAGGLQFPGPGLVSGPAGYQGPGDVVSGATLFGSCARAYNAAYANGTNPLCDLVAITGGATVCTLRVKTNGFVDLTNNYCGGTTPAAACAAASGNACLITKIWDQTGNNNHLTQITVANMPRLAFGVLNGLPSIQTFNPGGILSTPSMSVALPLSFVAVAQRTSNFTTGGRMIVPTTLAAPRLSFNSGANAVALNSGTPLTATAADSTFHAVQGIVASSGNSTVVVDGAATTGVAGNTAISSQSMSIMNDNSAGSPVFGDMMEAGIWPGFNATQYGNMNTNIHSATNGYNF